MSLAKRWCFTLNNPTGDEKLLTSLLGHAIIHDGGESICSYIVFGEETGAQGTPHLQGYLILRTKRRISFLKDLPGLSRAHWEVARASPKVASDYCKKDGEFHEFGELPAVGESKSLFADLRDWVASQPDCPTLKDVWDEFPSLAGRYDKAVRTCIELYGRKPVLVDGPLRTWQHALNNRVNSEPNDRHIYFVYDPEGNQGKSWLTRYWLSTRDDAQFMSVGKRDDLAFSVKVDTTLFIFDIPRGHMQYLQYGLLEQLKNRLVYSPKYCSTTKVLKNTPHVVVFANEEPDMTALTPDRYRMFAPIEFME
jgi:hypothetical protein